MLKVNNKDNRTTSLSIIQGVKTIVQKTFICSRVNNRNAWEMCKICWKLIMKRPERRYCVFIVNFKDIWHLFLVFLLLSLKR